MGFYLNPGNGEFKNLADSDFFVDKTGLIASINDCIWQEKHRIASSRPRRFGKTAAVRMLAAYYSRGCDSRALFHGLEIEKAPSFETHLNKYDVICLDIRQMRGAVLRKNPSGENVTILSYLQDEVLKELREEFPEYVTEKETSIADALAAVNVATSRQFIILIDEWDCLFREEREKQFLQIEYAHFLRRILKGSFVKLAYLTGIFPVEKYGISSTRSDFFESAMTAPGEIAPYIGFTEKEVKALCQKYHMPFAKMQKWYGGCCPGQTGAIYSPYSVAEAIRSKNFQNCRSQTEIRKSLNFYIAMEFDGFKEKIIRMLGGGRCKIDAEALQKDRITSDDVFTLFIHLGHLAYDSQTREAFIPNEEVRGAFALSAKDSGWNDVYRAILSSEALWQATLAMEDCTVAQIVQEIFEETRRSGSACYDGFSLARVIQVACYTAAKEDSFLRALPAGKGFSGMVFLPKRHCETPALVVELKWEKNAEGILTQIKSRNYSSTLGEYRGNTLLAGIRYDKKTGTHQCRIERYCTR